MKTFPALTITVLWLFAQFAAHGQSTAFTYQGYLSAGGVPASGEYEMSFVLYDAPTNGNVVGTGQSVAPVSASNGLFSVSLDFGSAVFDGSPRWLEITVNLFGSDMIPTTLAPRQPILPVPYAIHAANAAGLMSFVNVPLDVKINGERALRLEPASNLNPEVSGAPNVVAGSGANSVSFGVTGATIAGGGAVTFYGESGRNAIESDFGTIGGGVSNSISTQAGSAIIGGGSQNTIDSEAAYAVIGGGTRNVIAEDAGAATIGGGRENQIGSDGETIGGGYRNTTFGGYGTIAGGQFNSALSGSAAIGGGEANRVLEGARYATIGGGLGNTNSREYATIGGGELNAVSAFYATVGGGRLNTSSGGFATVAGGALNAALGTDSTVGGGSYNVARGNHSTVPGGYGNHAEGDYSFAGGLNAQANHTGAFVWSDASFASPLGSSTNNQFTARASGGVRFFTDTNAIVGAELSAGSGTWSSLSDRNAKENFDSAKAEAILDKLVSLPLATWNYKSQDKSIRHIGPTAQDFHAAFGVGEDERRISTVDADGVALAAIQGLNQKLEAKLAEQSALVRLKDAEVRSLRQRLDELEAVISKLIGKETGTERPSEAQSLPQSSRQ